MTRSSEVEEGGDQLWRGGIVYSAVDSPRGDHVQCYGMRRDRFWGGGGGTTYSMTVLYLVHMHLLMPCTREEACS